MCDALFFFCKAGYFLYEWVVCDALFFFSVKLGISYKMGCV